MKILFGIILGFLTISAFASDPMYDAATDEDYLKSKKAPVFKIFGDINMISKQKIQYEKPKIVARVIYPELKNDANDLNIAEFNEIIADIIQYEIWNFKNKVIEYRAAQQDMSQPTPRNSLFIDYDASIFPAGRDRIISIRFSLQAYLGTVPRPYHYHRVLNYNLRTNQVIALEELFRPNTDYINFLSDYALRALSRRSNQNSLNSESNASKSESYRNWNLKPNGLRITFDEGEQGTQTVLIPYGAIEEISSANSPIASCVKHPRSCAANSVLTGGFIDESAVNSRHGSFNPILSKL